MDTLATLLGLLALLIAVRAAAPVLWLHARYGVDWDRALVLTASSFYVWWTWRRFCRQTRIASIDKEGRITTRSALYSVMPGVRVERQGKSSYVYPRLRVRVDRYGLVGTVRTSDTAGLTEIAAKEEKIADRWGCPRVQVEKIKPGRVRIRGFRYEPLDGSFPSPLLDRAGRLAIAPKSITSADDIRIAHDQDGRPVYLNLAKSAHGLIAGLTRSGKSIAVNTVLASASLMSDVRLVVIDPNLAAAAPWWRTAHRACKDQHPEEPTRILAELRAEMERRQGHFWAARTDAIRDFSPELPLYLLVIDEVTNYTKHADKKAAQAFEAELLAIASQGAKFGIRLWLIAQKPSADVLPTAIRTNLSARICHRVDTAEDFVHLFADGRTLGVTAADRELPPGVAVGHVLGMRAPVRMKAPYLSTEACWDISDVLVAAGHGVRDLPGLAAVADPVITESDEFPEAA